MRFLLGLALGAAVILLAAEASTGGDVWRARLAEAGQRLQGLVFEVSSVPAGKRPAAAEAVALAGEAATADTGAQEPAPLSGPVTEEEGEPARQPLSRAPDPQPVDSADAVPDGASQDRHATGRPKPARLGAVTSGDQSVWVPFHSELSARGFAERLTESLNHPFRVERRGPGRYQVVFGYTDETERQALMAQATRATGLPL